MGDKAIAITTPTISIQDLRCSATASTAVAGVRKHLCPDSGHINQNPPRSLFPGGYKRPEISLPNLLLRLRADEVLSDGDVLNLVDEAVSDRIGIVVLTGGKNSGRKLYEAAGLLKSVIRDRAYLLIDDRIDIAAAIKASGVLLSDK
ncbi:hypothetical protein M569_10214, partial [Genlisea aurea]